MRHPVIVVDSDFVQLCCELVGPGVRNVSIRKAFKKKIKSVDLIHKGGVFGPGPHFFVKNKHGLKMCFKSF